MSMARAMARASGLARLEPGYSLTPSPSSGSMAWVRSMAMARARARDSRPTRLA